MCVTSSTNILRKIFFAKFFWVGNLFVKYLQKRGRNQGWAVGTPLAGDKGGIPLYYRLVGYRAVESVFVA